MALFVGQRVVCVYNFRRSCCKEEIAPEVGEVYTIRSMFMGGSEVFKFGVDGRCYLRLKEIVNREAQYREGYGEAAFQSEGFKPVRTTKKDIEIREGV